MNTNQQSNLTPFQRSVMSRIEDMSRAFSASIEGVRCEEYFADPFLTALNIQFKCSSGRCEVWLYPDEAEVIWGDRVARFEKDDYPHGGMEQAIIDCLALVFSGEAHRDPDAFPTASGCMLVPTFPFIWPFGKVYRDVREKKKKNE